MYKSKHWRLQFWFQIKFLKNKLGHCLILWVCLSKILSLKERRRRRKRKRKKNKKNGKYKKKKKNSESPASNLRPSTKQLTVVAKTNRLNKQQKKEQRKAIRKANKPQGEVKRLTQEELLEEAKITEQKNVASLAVLLKTEEDKKKELKKAAIVYTGPYIRYWSKGGNTLVNFSTPDIFPDIFTHPNLRILFNNVNILII